MRSNPFVRALAALCTVSCHSSRSTVSLVPEVRAEMRSAPMRAMAPTLPSDARVKAPSLSAATEAREVHPRASALVLSAEGHGTHGCVRYSVRGSDPTQWLPARLIVIGTNGTQSPEFGFDDGTPAAHNIVVSASGNGRLNLHPGSYKITFAHGPEWSIVSREIEVTPGPCTEIEASLDHVIAMTDWTGCDLHVHARPSYDAKVSVRDRVASLVAEGIEAAFPSEHNHVGSYATGVAALPENVFDVEDNRSPLVWAPAIEVSTQSWGHFNIFPINPRGGSLPTAAMRPQEIFRHARMNNPDGIIQVNHPRMAGGMGYFNRVGLDASTGEARSAAFSPEFDTIELFNGFQLRHREKIDAVLADWMTLLNHGARFTGTASSDAHNLGYQQAGYPRTYVYTPGAGDRSPPVKDIVDGLKAGRAFGTSGPMLFATVGDSLPGDTVTVPESRTVEVHVRVEAAAWVDVDSVEVWVDGVLQQSVPVAATSNVMRIDTTVPVTLRKAHGFIITVARGDRPLEEVLPTRDALPFAFTNPIWY